MTSQAPQCDAREEETPLATNDVAAASISVDGGGWQQSLHALFQGRISSPNATSSGVGYVIEQKELRHLVSRPRSTPSTRLGASATSTPRLQVLRGRVRLVFVIARQIIAHWQRRVRIRNELTTLNDGDLRDIGWTRAEVEAERRKPFWRA
jgi:uncharacterized protein YjiS (DUF1127 family)